MLREIVILTAAGTAFYVWLSAAVAPLFSAIRSIVRTPLDQRAWRASALAASTAVLWTIIASGAVLLLATFAPHAARAMAESPAILPAVAAGSAVWILRSIAMGVPRLSVDAEVASALAIVSLFRDDVQTLRSVESLYIERVLVRRGAAGVVVTLPPPEATARPVRHLRAHSTPSRRRRAG